MLCTMHHYLVMLIFFLFLFLYFPDFIFSFCFLFLFLNNEEPCDYSHMRSHITSLEHMIKKSCITDIKNSKAQSLKILSELKAVNLNFNFFFSILFYFSISFYFELRVRG